MEVEEEQAAAEGGNMPASEEEKNQVLEKYSTSTTEGVGIGINRKGLEQPKIDQGAEKRWNDKKSQEEPASEGGSAMIKKGQILLSKSEKTQVPTDVEEPNDAAQTHLLVVPKDASEKLQLKKTKENKSKRRELKKIKKELGSAEETRVPMDVEEPWKWHASFSSRLLHCSKKKRVDRGFILLQSKVKRVILLGTDETLLDTYYLKEEESIHIGSVLEFPCHKVDVGEPFERGIDNENEKPPSKRNEKRKRLKKKSQPLRSPEAALLRSSIGLFARVASSRKGMSPQAKRRKSESPSIPNVTAHFPSPNFPQRRRPRKLKSQIWKDFIPIYENGKLAQGQCKHCHEVFLASQSSGTNHMHRHVKTCVVRKNMHEMVAKLYASAASPQVPTLDGWNFSQEESRRDLANVIVQHGLPFSIVEYSGFIKFVKGLNPMFKMVSRTTIKDDCMDSYKEQRSILREILKNCGARVSLTADMWTSNQRLGYLCITCHYIDRTWKMQKRILTFCMMETPHSGYRMYNVMLKNLQYWNIQDKICSITLDNASVNGKMMEHLKENLMKKQMLICEGELFHIRCAAHVLNLIVQDGLFIMKVYIDKIRDSVKYIKSSQTREELFEGIVKQLGIISEKEPSIDVATRWNSTYLMIDSALPYIEAFDELAKQDQ